MTAKTSGSTPGPEPAARLHSGMSGEWRRFRRIFVVFAVLGAVIVGVPLVIGIVQARRAAAEERIVDQLKALCRVEYAWHKAPRDGSTKLRYAEDFAKLVDLQDAEEKDRRLVDAAFAAALGGKGAPKDGYLYSAMRTIFGAPINWDGDFAICATPARYGETGRKTYVMRTDGEVWEKDLGKSEFVIDYPTNIEGAGWVRAGAK